MTAMKPSIDGYGKAYTIFKDLDIKLYYSTVIDKALKNSRAPSATGTSLDYDAISPCSHAPISIPPIISTKPTLNQKRKRKNGMREPGDTAEAQIRKKKGIKQRDIKHRPCSKRERTNSYT